MLTDTKHRALRINRMKQCRTRCHVSLLQPYSRFSGNQKKTFLFFPRKKSCYSKWTYDVHSNNNPLVLDTIQYVKV